MPPTEYTKEAFDKEVDALVTKMRAYEPKVDGKTIHAAFDYALKMHGAQARESGEPYVVHPLKVAEILADMEMDQTPIVAALLHDCIEDTKASYDNIEQNFGADVARLVDGVTKLDGIEFRTKDEQKAESLRKMFFAMAKDIRVILIKIADRLHNMRTLKFCNEAKRVRTAKETIEVYAPLANRLGINSIKWELEDLCLRYLDPESYYDLVDRVSMRRQERMEAIDHIIDKLRKALDDANIKADITGRDITVLDMNDMAPVGAALLAGVGIGVFKDVYEASAKVEKSVYMEIRHSDAYKEVYDRRYQVYTGLYPSVKELYKVNLGVQ
mgnify:CR=1 FL=1